MSAGWEVGDLALCVDAELANLVEGRCYTVTEAFYDPGFNAKWEWSEFTLCVVEAQPLSKMDTGYCADRFRKILPDAHEDCEPEFVTLLNRIKHPVTA